MALVRDGLWEIVSGTEKEPEEENERRKFLAKRDRALATIMLAIDPELLYLDWIRPRQSSRRMEEIV